MPVSDCNEAVFRSLTDVQNAIEEYDDKESLFKRTSTTAQALATKCDKALSERRIDQLRDAKSRLMRCRQDAINRLKLLQSVQPTAEQLSAAVVELSAWLRRAEDMLASHRIDGSIEMVESRLSSHKVRFPPRPARGHCWLT
jgi:hypothetical protein